MKLNLRHRNAEIKSSRHSKRRTFAIKPLQALRTNRRAINAVISNIILIAAVIAVGFAVLIWSQYQSANYQLEYSDEVNGNIAQIQEKIVFQYVVREANGNLSVYLLNCGSRDVNISQVYVNGNNCSTAFTLHPFGAGTSVVPIGVGAQAKIDIVVPISVSSPYVVKIVTVRGSNFVSS